MTSSEARLKLLRSKKFESIQEDSMALATCPRIWLETEALHEYKKTKNEHLKLEYLKFLFEMSRITNWYIIE